MFKLFTLKSPGSGWSSEDNSRFLSFFFFFNVHKWREHLTLSDLHLLEVYSMMGNPRIVNYLITFYFCLLRVCMELLNMDIVVEFCKLINIKTVMLQSESWPFICLIFPVSWLALIFLPLLVVSSISFQIIAKDYCKVNFCYSSSHPGLLSDCRVAKAAQLSI